MSLLTRGLGRSRSRGYIGPVLETPLDLYMEGEELTADIEVEGVLELAVTAELELAVEIEVEDNP